MRGIQGEIPGQISQESCRIKLGMVIKPPRIRRILMPPTHTCTHVRIHAHTHVLYTYKAFAPLVVRGK